MVNQGVPSTSKFYLEPAQKSKVMVNQGQSSTMTSYSNSMLVFVSSGVVHVICANIDQTLSKTIPQEIPCPKPSGIKTACADAKVRHADLIIVSLPAKWMLPTWDTTKSPLVLSKMMRPTGTLQETTGVFFEPTIHSSVAVGARAEASARRGKGARAELGRVRSPGHPEEKTCFPWYPILHGCGGLLIQYMR